jgi:SecD/SecF fusion protein
MQSLKGAIKFLTIVLALACFYQISLTLVSYSKENAAEKAARAQVNATPPAGLSSLQQVEFKDSVEQVVKTLKRNQLDTILNKPIIDVWGLRDIYTYKYCRDHQLNLGLDLKGGMSLVMEISEDGVLRSLSNNSKSEQFNKAIDNAIKAQSNDQRDFLSIFKDEYEKLGKESKLAAIFAPVESYQGKINFTSTNDEVIKVLKADMNAAVKNTFQVLKTRIDQFGVTAPNISLQENTGRIILELPGVDDPTRVRKLLQQTAQLEFWDTYEVKEVSGFMEQAYKLVEETANAKKDTVATEGGSKASAADDLLGDAPAAKDSSKAIAAADTAKAKSLDEKKVSPLAEVLGPNLTQDGKSWGDGAVVGYSYGKDTGVVNRILARSDVKAIFPRDLKFLWGAKPYVKDGTSFALYAIKVNPASPEAPLAGDVITDAYKSYDQFGIPEVDLSMNALGASKWEKMTEAAVNANINGKTVKKCIAIVLDNKVFSAPRVQQKIAGGRSQITGLDGVEEADDLANILKSGKLEAKTRVIEEQVIGPSLGAESIRAGLLSLLAGFVIVFLFMVAYYSTSGIVANLAMILNLFFIIGTLASFAGSTLTLPGMAGIVLTLAMAVDANVIINERIREEIARGKGLRLAVEEGYRHSYSAIIDGNLTTMIVGFVLLFFGLGPVKGFATVLVIGLFTSLFTAVLVSQLFFDFAFSRNWNITFGNKFTNNLLSGIKYDFMGKRKISYTISAVVLTVSLASIIFYGFDLGVDFKGGRSYVVQFDKDVKTVEIARALEAPLAGAPQIKTYGSNNQLSITTAYMVEENKPGTDSLIEAKLYEGLKSFYNEAPSFESFRSKNIKSSIKIEATIADDIRATALWAGFFAILGVFIYIFVRFRRWEYATGAIVALIHDPIIVLGIFSLFRKVIPFSVEIDQNVVAAILTLIGYSVNDTVVVFDRIREFVSLHPTRTLIQNVNDSISTTLSRTIMTVATVLLVSLVLFFFGGDAIHTFAFVLIIGLLVGTYSSIFVASPVMVDLSNRKKDVAAK